METVIILSGFPIALFSYWTGRIIERRLPWFHFRPWLWFKSNALLTPKV